MGFFSSISHAISDVGNFIGGGITGSVGKIGIGGELLSGDFLDAAVNDIINNPSGIASSTDIFGQFWQDLKVAWDDYDRQFLEDLIVYIFGKEVLGSGGTIDEQKLEQQMTGGLMSQITGAVESAMKGSWSDFEGYFSGIFASISGDLKDITGGIEAVVGPIKNVVDQVTKEVQGINDSVVQPIRELIQAYQTATTTDLNKLTEDLHSGLSGILQLPQDLTNALTGVDAQFARATQELGSANKSIVTNDLVPGLNAGIGEPISGIKDVLTGPEYEPVGSVAFLETLPLDTPPETQAVIDVIKGIEKDIEDKSGGFGTLLKGILHLLQAADYEFRKFDESLEPYHQEARAKVKASLLSMAEATEAKRRDIISENDWRLEALKHGFNEERQNILYELMQYLFAPRDVVAMHERGIISDQDYELMIDQNNLDDSQAAALTELMQTPLNPADIAAGIARGFISDAQAQAMYRAAFVPEALRNIIPELEKRLISPERMARMEGRQSANAKGFLADTLSSAPPDDVKEQYNRTQAEAGAAELDWLSHWDIPQARWWCVAYFRGLRTLTEVEHAFEALNIPKEIWYDIIDTERELPPVWLVPDIVKTGVWSADKAIPTLMQLGFSEENAQVLYDYGVAAGQTAAKTAASELSKVSLGNAKSAFDDGLIDSATYTNILKAHNYDDESAQLTVELAEYNLAVQAQKNNADIIVSEVRLGQIDINTAQSNLYNLGLTTKQVEQYLQKIEAAQRANAKLPSVSMLEQMYKKALISEKEAADMLVTIGYDPTWAVKIIQIWG